MTSAETAYLFRHALLRGAAFQLQPRAARARLHVARQSPDESGLRERERDMTRRGSGENQGVETGGQLRVSYRAGKCGAPLALF